MPRCLKCNAEMPNNTQDGLCPKCEALVNRAVQRNSIQVGNRPAADAEDSFLEKTGDSSRLRRSGNPAARGGVSFTAAEIRERIAARVPAQFPPQEDLPDKTADPLQIQSLRDRIPGMASGAPQSIRRPAQPQPRPRGAEHPAYSARNPQGVPAHPGTPAYHPAGMSAQQAYPAQHPQGAYPSQHPQGAYPSQHPQGAAAQGAYPGQYPAGMSAQQAYPARNPQGAPAYPPAPAHHPAGVSAQAPYPPAPAVPDRNIPENPPVPAEAKNKDFKKWIPFLVAGGLVLAAVVILIVVLVT